MKSMRYMDGLEEAPITIVCDGCRPASSLESGYRSRLADRLDLNPCKFSKRGIVTDAVSSNYEEYKTRLVTEAEQAGYNDLSLLQLDEHQGFAMAVKAGLESVLDAGARYAMVVQHDRAFCRQVPRHTLTQIFDQFRLNDQMRYCGFPSGTSKLLAEKTEKVYKLDALLKERTIELHPSLSLRPSIFWYDSNHIVDARKALEIYEPYANAPSGLLERLGGVGLNRFRLRKGDFIEERFGVEQRNLLTSLRDEPAECLRYFDWFGTYLLEEVIDEETAAAEAAKGPPIFMDKRGRVTYIDHIDARGSLLPSQRRAGAVRVPPKRRAAGDIVPTPSTLSKGGPRLRGIP